MAIGIDDLDFNENDLGIQNEGGGDFSYVPDFDSMAQEKPWMDGTDYQTEQTVQPEPAAAQEQPQTEDDIIISLLKSKGISDPTKLKFENEEGEIEEVDWSSLSNEEKLNILTSDDSDVEYGLDDEETKFLNFLRQNGVTPNEYIEYQKQLALQEYQQSLEGNPQYEVDKLTNDELYILDLQARVQDITDEEANAALEQEKANPALFEKKMQGIRNEYVAIEQERAQQEQILQAQQDNEAFEEFKSGVLGAIEGLTEIGGVALNLEDDDLNELANFILSSDAAGVSYLGKALDDPETLAKMAWFALKGEEAFEALTDYYDKEITKQKRTAYEAGYEDAKKGVQPKSKSKVVTKPSPKSDVNTPPAESEKSIDNLDF